VTTGPLTAADRGVLSAAATAAGRGPEHQVAALTLAGLTFTGGLLGILNLTIDGVVREGAARGIYAATMTLCMALAVPLVLRQRAGRWATAGMVLLGQLIYVVVSLCVVDAARFSTPLMLLFCSFVAAWFLGPVELGVSMALTFAACALAQAPSYPDRAELAIQVLVSAGMLNASSLGVFVLRRRVQRLLEATRALSTTDPLTGLRNRRHLVEQAPRVWRQARRDGTRVAAMVLDLDHFKRLNDEHGHAAGDAVLVGVGEALGATVRPSDVLARTGGEELVVLGQVGDDAEARHLAERLRAAVAAVQPGGHRVTASVGVALVRPEAGDDPADALWRLVDRADAAMYEAKRRGRDQVSSAGPEPRPARAVLPPPRRPAPAARQPERPGGS
jgi:diguanylate cyclase (GGDEF)-like protein